jgi:pimeloyl-ACP methyl ester carboxylesterase
MKNIIFIHGSGTWGGIWTHQLRHFPEAEAVTLPGHPEGKLRSDVGEYADWLHGYIHGRGHKDIVLVGHSFGGAIAVQYALKHGDGMSGLVLVSAGPRLRPPPALVKQLEEAVNGDLVPWHTYLQEQLRRLPEKERQTVAARIRDIGPRVQLSDLLTGDRFDATSLLPRIHTPTLVVTGDNDTTPPKIADHLVQKIAGSKKVIVKNAGYFPMLEQPDEFNRVLEEFLEALESIKPAAPSPLTRLWQPTPGPGPAKG